MTIYYFSIDMDGCFFNNAYYKALKENSPSPKARAAIDRNRKILSAAGTTWKDPKAQAVIEQNPNILAKIAKQMATASDTYGFIGSTRQSMYLDRIGGFSSGSCISAMETICTHLKCELDPFLLADVSGKLDSGTSFQLIKDEIANDRWYNENHLHQHAKLPQHDQFKRVLLFAQMQKAASDQAKLHPGETIVFDFFDDRPDILNALTRYFTNHPHMIPRGVTLNLNGYAGDTIDPVASIPGTGAIHENYLELVREMNQNLDDLEDFALRLGPDGMSAMLEGLMKKGLCIRDIDDVNTFFERNPKAPFAIVPSPESPPLITFTVVYQMKKEMRCETYAASLEDKRLYCVKDDGKLVQVPIQSHSLIATLTKSAGIKPLSEKAELESIDSPEKEEPLVDKLINGLKASPFYFADRKSGEEEMKKNPAMKFFLRPSKATIRGYITFSVTFMTDKAQTHLRYGLNPKGELFILNGGKRRKKEIQIDGKPENIIASIAADVVKIQKKVTVLDDTLNPSVKNTEARKKNGLFAQGKTLSDVPPASNSLLLHN